MSPLSLSAGSRLGLYEVLSPIGAGGMGEVYRARDTKLGREIAIKVLPEVFAQDNERRKRFDREAQSIAALNHPNIVHVYSVEEAEGVHFITMELVEGKTLAEILPKNGFPLDRFFEMAVPLAEAFAAAHEKGITHRDLKPQNVMVSDEGRVKVLDFGLAKTAKGLTGEGSTSELPTETKTQEGAIVGTLSYMSPEQAQGKAIDARSDIFSLGIIFHEMLTGRRPFGGETPAETMSSIIKDSPPSVVEARPETPRELTRLVGRCLAKDPSRRIQTAIDVRNELEESRDAGEGPAPRPTGVNRWLAAATVGLVLALVGVVV